MKKIKMPSIILVAFLFLILFLSVQDAFAAVPESDVNIKFVEGNTIVNPVDPDDPSKPLEPSEPGTGQAGPLTLNYVSPIEFGQQEISTVTKEYPSLITKPFIQVTDTRGTGVGWRVEAVGSHFKSGGEDSLLGSTITFNRGEAISVNMALAKPVPEQTVTIPTDGVTAVPVVQANAGAGLGTWVIRWYPNTGPNNDSVRLRILAGTATLGSHKATITWRLIDAP